MTDTIDEMPQLQEALDEAPIEHPDIVACLAEARRLCVEAEERFESGRVLSTLSSLMAIPPLHQLLTDRLSNLVLVEGHADSDVSVDAGDALGAYL